MTKKTTYRIEQVGYTWVVESHCNGKFVNNHGVFDDFFRAEAKAQALGGGGK